VECAVSGVPVIEAYAARPRGQRLLEELDRIFFEASGTKTFASEAARAAFREVWLGGYLARDAAHALLAVVNAGTDAETLAGYLVGSLDDPACESRFDDLGYFKLVADLTARYPAQLHINLAPEWRGRGLGRALVDAFCVHAAAAGAPGVHVFTGRGMRNVSFYNAAGFHEVGAVEWNGREIVMLARPLNVLAV
jgi:GNAT superfamily N-acetyltransferase